LLKDCLIGVRKRGDYLRVLIWGFWASGVEGLIFLGFRGIWDWRVMGVSLLSLMKGFQ